MPAETKLFLCLKDNYGVLIHDPRERRDRRDRRARGGAGRGRAQGHRLEAHRHPGDASPRRPHRRHRRAEEEAQLPRGGAAGGGGEDPAGRRDRARGRQGQRRQARRERDRDARPHRGPHHLLVPRRQARLRRRHAVLDRLRPRDRRHAGDDVGVAAEAPRSAGRHAGLLRPRIHAGEHQVRADHRAGQRGARGARRGGGEADRRRHSRPFRPRSTRRRRPIRSCAPTCRRSPPPSALPASRPPRCSPRSGRGRTSSRRARLNPSRARRRSRPRSSPRRACRRR